MCSTIITNNVNWLDVFTAVGTVGSAVIAAFGFLYILYDKRSNQKSILLKLRKAAIFEIVENYKRLIFPAEDINYQTMIFNEIKQNYDKVKNFELLYDLSLVYLKLDYLEQIIKKGGSSTSLNEKKYNALLDLHQFIKKYTKFSDSSFTLIDNTLEELKNVEDTIKYVYLLERSPNYKLLMEALNYVFEDDLF